MAIKKLLCPYCFEEFKNNEAWYQCESIEPGLGKTYLCDRIIRKEYDLYWKLQDNYIRYVWPQKGGLSSKLFGPKLKEEKCPQCGQRSRRFVCPHCFNWLDPLMVEDGVEIISVIGSPSSGKTNYIVSLIKELGSYGWKLDLMALPTQLHRDGHDEETTQNIYEALQTKLFKDKEVLDKTTVATHDTPWIFHLDQQCTRRHVYLVFYDSAGEKFQQNLKNNVKYLKASSGVIILLDTLSIDYIGEILKKKGLEGYGGKTEDPLTAMMTSIVNSDDEGIYKKPVAFAFSKFDTVLDHSADLGFSSMEFMKGNQKLNSSYIDTGEVDLEKIDDISNVIEKALVSKDAWNKGEIWKFAQKWASKKNKNLPLEKQDRHDPENNYKFFGVSAFGHMPDENDKLQKIEPYRVMDPLIWVLHKLGQFKIPIKNDK